MYKDNILNDLSKANYYFNKLLYRDILFFDEIANKKKENKTILGFYEKQKKKKKIYKIIKNIYLREIIYNLKINYIYEIFKNKIYLKN